MSEFVGRLDVSHDPAELAQRLAEWMTVIALGTVGPIRILLSGGSTPIALYTHLASPAYRSRFPWSRVSWYWGDERFVPHDDPKSNYGAAHRALFSHVPVSADDIHAMPVDGTPVDAAKHYERTLMNAYGDQALHPSRALFDIALLGLGEDGHIASLLPGDAALDEQRRWVVSVPHGRAEARLTLTFPALESSRHVAFMISGASKAPVFARVCSGDRRLPATRLSPTGELHWFVDRVVVAPPSPGPV